MDLTWRYLAYELACETSEGHSMNRLENSLDRLDRSLDSAEHKARLLGEKLEEAEQKIKSGEL